MADSGFIKQVSQAICDDCGNRMTRRERYSFAQEKYVCENQACPGKNNPKKGEDKECPHMKVPQPD